MSAARAIRTAERLLAQHSRHSLKASNIRVLSTSSHASSSRMGRGNRYTLSRNQRRPSHPSATHPTSNHASHPVASHSDHLSHPTTSPTNHQAEPRTSPEHAATNFPTDPSVHVPAVVPEDAHSVLQTSSDFSGAKQLLTQSALVVTREIEMMNIFLGFEQVNKYSIHSPTGELVGYLAEEEQGLLGGALQRQVLRTHRPFRATVMDASGKPVLMIRRPFTWINSTASIFAVRSDYPVGYGAPQDADLELIGEVQQRWHLYKRRYELFLKRQAEEGEGGSRFVQFAAIDAGFLSWTFLMQDAESRLVGAIDRNFRGFGREIFTDTGQYVLRFDSVGQTAMADARLVDFSSSASQAKPQGIAEGLEMVESHGTRALTLDERAVALATAVSIDFDYFSRHSEGMHGGGGMLPWMMMPGMGGGGGGEAAETPKGGPNDNVPSNPNGNGDGGFGTGVAGGAIGSGMDYPYGASDSGMSEDGRLGQPPSNPNGYGDDSSPQQQEQSDSPWWNADQQQQGGQEGDVWGTGNSDPWAGAGDTQQQDDSFWGGWGGNGGGDGGGGGGWGGFFGGDGDGGGGDW
ncbi:scramblase [Pseudozyma hubeiensis SY62]|uniref:Scramblase n=1 Tax=Pseudozyma hubeiensis (strain SY62) TaxID=1305764 RepID=R9NZR2_PSEHS|nr:scramblase [Pseudozyma hubeiensis SY62]GAC94227.1 scramblase [Pseudozyma hubeiensis SY62]